jgi:DNA-directed RNA polymerase subunit RPC12/RpoP
MIYDLGFCENCGADLREDDNYLCEECENALESGLSIEFIFCGRCGKKLKKSDICVEYDPVSGPRSYGYKCPACGFKRIHE